ncbi:MAG: class I SAM-dependent methyltransferase [Actinomycetota bacterium]|nr:class I SAM-dependent methyltransferase [Actinomycetota bacterium]
MATAKDVFRAIRAVPARDLGYAAARLPLEVAASRQLSALPRVELAELTGPVSYQAVVAPASTRHGWSLGAAEQIVMQAVVAGRGVRSAFEIGTFNGGTTRVLAEAVPDDGRVVTMDLPPADFEASQRPVGFVGSEIGAAYRDSPAAARITQLLENSLTFDVVEHAAGYDLVLVDGGHDYVHGVADTRTALQLVAPGGLVVWDDFEPYWHGLVRGICQEMLGRRLCRLAGTAFGVYVNETADGMPGDRSGD